ncbi:MAG: hypothetical protein JWO36_5298 [Myxococcales bacterium]|nr:hypothetical protein [Myxococcales bacterium]
MGEAACDVLQAELALDLLDGKLATELPPHMRAFARAYATGSPPPSAPAILSQPQALQTARNACMHDLLVARGLALLRLAAPIAIEDDPFVRALRGGPPSWSGITALAAARDRAAQSRFGARAIPLLHRLHGVTQARGGAVEVETSMLPGWKARQHELDGAAIEELWRWLSGHFGVRGTVQVERSAAKSRTFVVVPGSAVIVVVPISIASPAARFAVLHELGHAVAAVALPDGIPRALDEGVAALVARLAESPSVLPAVWHCELAAAARVRRAAIAMLLAEIERGLPELPAVPPSASPPHALWDDPGAQGCYVEAEVIADRLQSQLAGDGRALPTLLAGELERIDRRAQL